MTSTEFVTSATDRANKVLAFDSSGELSVTQELGTVKGNWAASTAYVVRDIIKDYDAVMSSVDHLKGLMDDSGWPEGLTIEENLIEGLDKLQVNRSEFPAITHVDFSARVQTVNKESNEFFYSILKSFHDYTGCPMVINTSFNIRGEPIVNTVEDAIRCFMHTKMDVFASASNYLREVNNSTNIIK